MRRNLGKRGEAARVALDCDHMARAFGEKRPRQTAGAGTDFDDCGICKRAGGACNSRSEIEIEEKILAERLFGGEPMRGDDLAQRRQSILHLCVPAGGSASRAARRSAAMRLAGSALPSAAMSKAVP